MNPSMVSGNGLGPSIKLGKAFHCGTRTGAHLQTRLTKMLASGLAQGAMEFSLMRQSELSWKLGVRGAVECRRAWKARG